MKTYNVYEAKTQLSKLLDMAAAGESITIARNGKPLVDLKPHKPKSKIKFGIAKGKYQYDEASLTGLDPDVQSMFYGEDWNNE